MSTDKMLLLIPVENQVRELDPKLLLACIAASRGFSSVIGSRRQMDFRIASFPRGLYLSKSMTVRSIKMFKILQSTHIYLHPPIVWIIARGKKRGLEFPVQYKLILKTRKTSGKF